MNAPSPSNPIHKALSSEGERDPEIYKQIMGAKLESLGDLDCGITRGCVLSSLDLLRNCDAIALCRPTAPERWRFFQDLRIASTKMLRWLFLVATVYQRNSMIPTEPRPMAGICDCSLFLYREQDRPEFTWSPSSEQHSEWGCRFVDSVLTPERFRRVRVKPRLYLQAL